MGRNLYNLRQAIVKQRLAPSADYADCCLLEGSTELADVLFFDGELHGLGLEDAIVPRDTEFIKGRHTGVPATGEWHHRLSSRVDHDRRPFGATEGNGWRLLQFRLLGSSTREGSLHSCRGITHGIETRRCWVTSRSNLIDHKGYTCVILSEVTHLAPSSPSLLVSFLKFRRERRRETRKGPPWGNHPVDHTCVPIPCGLSKNAITISTRARHGRQGLPLYHYACPAPDLPAPVLEEAEQEEPVHHHAQPEQ